MQIDEVRLDKKLFLRWTKECYLAGAKGISFETIKKQVNNLFAKTQEKEK